MAGGHRKKDEKSFAPKQELITLQPPDSPGRQKFDAGRKKVIVPKINLRKLKEQNDLFSPHYQHKEEELQRPQLKESSGRISTETEPQ